MSEPERSAERSAKPERPRITINLAHHQAEALRIHWSEWLLLCGMLASIPLALVAGLVLGSIT